MRPIELLVATFENDEGKAGEVLQGLRQLEEEKALDLIAVAVIVNPKEGEIEVKDFGDVDSKHGKVFGAITGALIGLIGGPVGAVIGGVAGAATGNVAAKVIDRGVPNRLVEATKNGLQPGSSAIIIYAELSWVDRAVAVLEKEGAIVHHETLQLKSDYIQHLTSRVDDE